MSNGTLNTANSLLHISCFLQEQCCGAYNHTDYSRFSEWEKPSNYPSAKVPLSCCKKTSAATGDDPTSSGDFTGISECYDGDVAHINDKVFDITALTSL